MIDYTRKLARIAEISAQVGEEREGIAKIVEETAGLFNTSIASAFRIEQDGRLKYLAGLGVPARSIRRLEEASNSGWIIDLLDGSPKPMVVHARKDSPAQEVGAWADILDIATISFAPLQSEGQTLGILVLYHRTPYDYKPHECDMLQIAAVLASGLAARLPLGDGNEGASSKSQLFSVLSHELRTPLTSIMGFTQLIRKRVSASSQADPRTMEQLDVLWAQAQRLNRLIDTFVDMARIERGEFEIARGKAELTSLLKSASEQAGSQASSHHVINMDIPGEPVWLHGDSKRLEQVFGHVISNAIRYSSQSQPIRVTCKENANQQTVTIRVSDRGPGIPAPRLKEVFARNYPSGPLKSGGLGVGLYLSKVIVEAHGGQISIESASGKGTSVVIVLPV